MAADILEYRLNVGDQKFVFVASFVSTCNLRVQSLNEFIADEAPHIDWIFGCQLLKYDNKVFKYATASLADHCILEKVKGHMLLHHGHELVLVGLLETESEEYGDRDLD